MESGGKRLRPMLVLLSSQALGFQGSGHVHLAAIIEFLHTATLLHDDVVDSSALRRGRATVNDRWGNAPSVLVGDFLYSRAFQLMVELANLDVMAVLAKATNTIAEGEVMQLTNIGNCAMTEADYRQVIRSKTALLFEAASHTGALLAAQSPTSSATGAAPVAKPSDQQVTALQQYGLHFGMAYQLIDDWLDYAGSTELMGKTSAMTCRRQAHPAFNSRSWRGQFEQTTRRYYRPILRQHGAFGTVQDSGSLEYTA